ncbi:MAG: TonB-dependent receptor [Fidelibacterota bacterium]|nr:MAG: TonB-dependent receptor [Candidatus Neomarinimicrobiota bacterium]
MMLTPGLYAQSVGALIGQITDLDTHQPLIGANVMVEGTALGAATDMQGHYRITGIPVGSYSLRVSMIGYKQQARANIHVVPQRETIVNLALETTVLAGEEVIVTAGFFERTKDAVVSARTVDIEEIRSDPVGAYDVFRMMESLPAVACGTDQLNEIIVRGGAPGQNLFVMDHLEIPYPNHFPQSQQQSGGPVALVNTEFLERADFYAGAFPARYGGKVSSVMDVTLREGNRNRHLAEFNFNMSGIGLVAEGPFTEQGSYLVSYDRSFLDLVIKSIGLAAIPRYSSLQAKVVYDIDLRRKLMVNFLGGKDEIAITGEPEDEKPGTYYANYGGDQYTLGVTYKNLFSQQGYLLASLGRNYTLFDIDATRIMTGGIEEEYVRKYDSETESTLKVDALYRISEKWELSGGMKLQHAQLSFSDWLYFAPVVQYGYAADAMAEPVSVSRDYFDTFIIGNDGAVVQPLDTLVPGYDLTRDKKAGIFKSALYSQIRWFPTPRIEIILGGRLEGGTLPEEVTISPRFGLSYGFTDKLSLNVSAGRYFQAPFYDQLIHYQETPGKLTSYYTDQAVAGLEWLAAEDFRSTFEFYARRYGDLPISHAETTPDTSDSFGGYVNAGEGHSYGLEVYLQKKFTRQWYGSCSYSWSVAEGIDPRYPGEDKTYPWDYDFRHVFTLIGGYKIKYMDYDWYPRYKESLFGRLFSWIPIAPSDEFEISFRGRYVGGRPYTPMTYDHHTRSWAIYQAQEFNTQRLKEYIRFDIMILQRFYFKKMNLVAFWDIMNVFNRDNPWGWQHFDDGTKEVVWQYKTFPVGGLTLEF